MEYYNTKPFWKIYLKEFTKVLRKFNNKQLNVFIYILEHINTSDNKFIATYDKISSATKVSRPTIAKIMKSLQESGFLIKVQHGVWCCNPNILIKGNDNKRALLNKEFLKY